MHIGLPIRTEKAFLFVYTINLHYGSQCVHTSGSAIVKVITNYMVLISFKMEIAWTISTLFIPLHIAAETLKDRNETTKDLKK